MFIVKFFNGVTKPPEDILNTFSVSESLCIIFDYTLKVRNFQKEITQKQQKTVLLIALNQK